jgi:hypothetical protein
MEDVFATAFEDLERLKDVPPQKEAAPSAAPADPASVAAVAPVIASDKNLEDVFASALEGIGTLRGSEVISPDAANFSVEPGSTAMPPAHQQDQLQKGFDEVFDDALAGLSRLREETLQDPTLQEPTASQAPEQDTAAYIEHWRNKLKKEP